MAGGEQTHTIKYVEFLGETRPIILQNLAGSCPLLAICNVLLLRRELNLSPLAENISQKKLLDMVAHKLNSVTNNPQHNSAHVISRLATGIDVNIKFKGITEFELTTERVLFDLLNIPLYHGWIVDPQDSKTYNALGSKSYNTILGDLVGLETGFVGIEDEKRPEEDSVTTGKLIKNFLATTTSQLTVHGLVCLRKELKEHELCVLFRNNHLSTMFKFGGQLYLLVTEEGYKDHPNVVWEMLNEVNGNTPFMTGNFKKFRAECDYVSNTCVEENFWTAEYLASTNDAAHDNSSFK
ncbi:hypothetical protein ACET3Z_005289 [Daucus carota]